MASVINSRLVKLEQSFLIQRNKPVIVWINEGENRESVLDKADQEHPGCSIRLISWLPSTAR
jgi:hypothetical protein